MELELKDKVFIVTGGGSGIGGGISKALGREGAIPVIFGRSPLDEDFWDEIRQIQPKTHFKQFQLSDEMKCREAVNETKEMFGKIDGLVNCAGANDSVSLEDPVRAFRDSLENNLVHYHTMAHYCIPFLKESTGTILNISSKTAITGQGDTSGYTAAKGAQMALTREWAASYLDEGIRVNCVVPAEVWTPLYANWLMEFPNAEEKLKTIIRNIPLGRRMTSIEEIADTAIFLLSPRSSHTTGQIVIVDGGYTHLDRALTAGDPDKKDQEENDKKDGNAKKEDLKSIELIATGNDKKGEQKKAAPKSASGGKQKEEKGK